MADGSKHRARPSDTPRCVEITQAFIDHASELNRFHKQQLILAVARAESAAKFVYETTQIVAELRQQSFRVMNSSMTAEAGIGDKSVDD